MTQCYGHPIRGDRMPIAAGISASQIADLLVCVTRATKEEKQAALEARGMKVPRTSHIKMARGLVKRAASLDAAAAAAMELWWEYATEKAREVLRLASVEGRGPRSTRRPPSTDAFFKANGDVTRIGEFAFEWIKRGTGTQPGLGRPLAPVPENVQGGAEHQGLQRAICRVGRRRGYFVETNHSVGSDFRADVLWFLLDPKKHRRAGPLAVFEIEFGESAPLAKSLSSLAHCHVQWPGTKLFLLVPRQREKSARSRLETCHREIEPHTKVLVVEDCKSGLAEFEEQLGFVQSAEEPPPPHTGEAQDSVAVSAGPTMPRPR